MKKLIPIMLFIVGVLLLIGVYSIQASTLKWDASTGDVTGYVVYYTDGIESFNYDAGVETQVLDIDNTLNLHPGKTYTFTATAYNSVGESPMSTSVDYATAAVYTPPGNIIPILVSRPTVITIIVE